MRQSILRLDEADIDRPNWGPGTADGAIEGDPVEKAHEIHSKDGRTSGVWECTPGRILEEAHTEDEFCTILGGRLTLVDNESGEEETFTAGDSFYLPKGSSLTWVVHETVRKFYMTAE